MKKTLLASYTVAYKIAICKKSLTIGKELILPAAIEILETMLRDNLLKHCNVYLYQMILLLVELAIYLKIYSNNFCRSFVRNFSQLRLNEATDSTKNCH